MCAGLDGWTSRAKLADARRGGAVSRDDDDTARREVATLAGLHGGRSTRVNRFELIEKPAATIWDVAMDRTCHSVTSLVQQPMSADNQIGGEVAPSLSRFDDRYNGTHSHLAFVTLPLPIPSVAFLKLTASSRLSASPSGSPNRIVSYRIVSV